MPLSRLDPRSALLIIDLQKGNMGYPTVHPMTEIVERSAKLADAFRHLDLPVVLVNVRSLPPGRTEVGRYISELPLEHTEFVSELGQQPQDHVVTKRSPGAFTSTGLGDHLRSCGITQVVIAGISTSMGVESTARQAYELGFNVTLATDAITDMDLETHSHCILRIFPKLGETTTVRSIVDFLEHNVS